MRYLLSVALNVGLLTLGGFATICALIEATLPAAAQQTPPSLYQQLDPIVSQAASLNSDVVNMRNLILSQDAANKQLSEQNAALTKQVADLKAQLAKLTPAPAEAK
jgi:small-conductance mechanosensitive channel